MEDLYPQVQQALDELAEEKKMAFKLRSFAELQKPDFANYYKLEFWDSPIVELVIYWKPGRESFKDALRDAIKRALIGNK
jgi:hypothetical protein